jgi:hypothetical protein
MHRNLSPQRISLVLGGLLVLACDQKADAPTAEPTPAQTTEESPPAGASSAEAPTPAASVAAPVVADEVAPAVSASAGAKKGGGKEKKCAQGACAPGKCG